MKRFWRAVLFHALAPALLTRPRKIFLVYLFSTLLAVGAYSSLTVQGIPVALVDLDNSSVSRTLRLLLSSQPLVDVQSAPFTSPDEAKQALIAGEVAAVVLIPPDFSTSIKRGRPANVTAAIDGSNILVAKNAYKAIVTAAVSFGVGVSLIKAEKAGVPSSLALPAVLPLRLDASRPFNPAANYAIYVVPGLVFFLLTILLTLLGASHFQPALEGQSWSERLGASLGTMLLGVLCSALLVGTVLPFVSIVRASPWSLILLMSALFALATGLLVIAVHGLLPAPPLAMDVCVFMGMLSLMASGVTFPTDLFPSAIASTSYILPLQPFAQAFQLFLHRSTELAEIHQFVLLLLKQCCGWGTLAALSWTLRAFMEKPRTLTRGEP